MKNTTHITIPPLPSYTLSEQPSLVPGVPDILLQLLAPVIAYWVVSLFFHILDVYDLCAQYRLHTPAELLARNRVSRYEVLRDVIIQQVFQTALGLLMGAFDPPTYIGKENYDVAVWAQRVRKLQIYLPHTLAVVGLNSVELAGRLSRFDTLASILSGGRYSFEGFAPWELSVAKIVYHVVVPLIQFFLAICFVDTWQYFIHRGMHMNKFLYTKIHARHHRLYVPYAYGALYNHPVEGFILDSVGTAIGYLLMGMTVRQGLVFFTCSTIKTVDDHCGYAFPWDPLQHLTSNNAAYHDVHHQSWGIKANFSQPYSTFWDRVFGTIWTGGDVSLRYERDRIAAQKKIDVSSGKPLASVTNSPATDPARAAKQASEGQQQVLETDGAVVLEQERQEEETVRQSLRKTSRGKSGSFDPRSTFSERVPSLHGNRTPILHADGLH